MKARLGKHIFAALLLLCFVFVPLRSTKAQNPWEFLDSFTLVPDSQVRLGEHHAGALFVDSEKGLLAAVIFNVSCDSGSCDVNYGAAYSVFNAEGLNIRLYVDPQDQELAARAFNRQIV